MGYPYQDWSGRSDQGLRSIIATFSSSGRYGIHVKLARVELDRRGIDYSDCISAEER